MSVLMRGILISTLIGYKHIYERAFDGDSHKYANTSGIYVRAYETPK
jgi:hypothetical protein